MTSSASLECKIRTNGVVIKEQSRRGGKVVTPVALLLLILSATTMSAILWNKIFSKLETNHNTNPDDDYKMILLLRSAYLRIKESSGNFIRKQEQQQQQESCADYSKNEKEIVLTGNPSGEATTSQKLDTTETKITRDRQRVSLGKDLLKHGDAIGAVTSCASATITLVEEKDLMDAYICAGEASIQLYYDSRRLVSSSSATNIIAVEDMQKSRIEQAREFLNAAMELDPINPRVRAALGLCFFFIATATTDKSNSSKSLLLFDAIQHFTTAASYYSKDADVHLGRRCWYNAALCFIQLRQYSAAILLLRKAVEDLHQASSVEDIIIWNALGACLIKEGKTVDALSVLKNAKLQYCIGTANIPETAESCSLIENSLGVAMELYYLDEQQPQQSNIKALIEEQYDNAISLSETKNIAAIWNKQQQQQEKKEIYKNSCPNSMLEGSCSSSIRTDDEHIITSMNHFDPAGSSTKQMLISTLFSFVEQQHPQVIKTLLEILLEKEYSVDSSKSVDVALQAFNMAASNAEKTSSQDVTLHDAVDALQHKVKQVGDITNYNSKHQLSSGSFDSASTFAVIAELQKLQMELKAQNLKLEQILQQQRTVVSDTYSGTVQNFDGGIAASITDTPISDIIANDQPLYDESSFDLTKDDEAARLPTIDAAFVRNSANVIHAEANNEESVLPVANNTDGVIKVADVGSFGDFIVDTLSSSAAEKADDITAEFENLNTTVLQNSIASSIADDQILISSSLSDDERFTSFEEKLDKYPSTDKSPPQNITNFPEESSPTVADDMVTPPADQVARSHVSNSVKISSLTEEKIDPIAEETLELPSLYNGMPRLTEEVKLSALEESNMKIADSLLTKQNYLRASKQLSKVIKSSPNYLPARLGYANSLEGLSGGKHNNIKEITKAYAEAAKVALLQDSHTDYLLSSVGDGGIAEAILNRALGYAKNAPKKDRVEIYIFLIKAAHTTSLAAEMYYLLGIELLSSINGVDDPAHRTALQAFLTANQYAELSNGDEGKGHGKSLVELAKIALYTTNDPMQARSLLNSALACPALEDTARAEALSLLEKSEAA